MQILLAPLETAWDWVGNNFGRPGQFLVLLASIIAVLGILMWIGNRRGAGG